MVVFLIILAFLALLAIAVSVSMQARADALQAQAAIEAARAAQIAASGQAINSAMLTFLVVAFGLTLLVALILLGYMLYQRSKPQPQGKWLAGPNAKWGRVGDASRLASLPQPQGDPLQQLVQLEVLRYLRQMNAAPLLPPHTNLPYQEDDDEPLW
ncbi:MAG: hypothetical protein HRF47_13980 [Chloroflexota bacterium]|jgi:hypothetical protein